MTLHFVDIQSAWDWLIKNEKEISRMELMYGQVALIIDETDPGF